MPIAQLGALGAIVCALVLLGVAPFVSRVDIGEGKYLPILIAWVSWGFHLATCRAALPQALAVLRRHWPLALVGATMAIGFAVAMRHGHLVTFRPHALAMLTFFPMCHLAACADPARFAAAALHILGLGSIWIMSLAIVSFPRHVVHENLYLFVPGALFLAFAGVGASLRWIAAGWAALYAVVGLKNTTFIIAVLSIYAVHVFGQPAVRLGLRRPLQWQGVALLGLAGVAGWTVLETLKSSVPAFSSGNAEFRTYLYEQKWAMFLDSPLWGDLWSGTPNLRFRLFEVLGGVNFLPSHSDLLDWLAHGGVLGFLALAWTVGLLLRRAHDACREDRGGRGLYAARAALLVICFSGLVSASFNPVLGNPANGFMFWSVFALLGAIELRWLATDGTWRAEAA